MTGVPKSKYFHPLASKNFPINICLFVAETLVYKYTTLFGRVWNGCLHDFKFAEMCSNFRTILYLLLVWIIDRAANAWLLVWCRLIESTCILLCRKNIQLTLPEIHQKDIVASQTGQRLQFHHPICQESLATDSRVILSITKWNNLTLLWVHRKAMHKNPPCISTGGFKKKWHQVTFC